MEKRNFTIVVDSLKGSGNTNNCVIKINCPQSFSNKLICEVMQFSLGYPINTDPDSSYIKLICNGLNIIDQYSNNNKNILTIYDNRNYRYSRNTFYCDNFNNRELNFQLINESDELLTINNNQFNYPWVVIIKCTEI